MNKINDARKALLSTQLEHAVVEIVGTPAGEPGLDPDYYSVFVPGAIREYNFVSAASAEEAKEKVKSVLESKIDQMSETPAEAVEISPDDIKKRIGVTVRQATEEEING